MKGKGKDVVKSKTRCVVLLAGSHARLNHVAPFMSFSCFQHEYSNILNNNRMGQRHLFLLNTMTSLDGNSLGNSSGLAPLLIVSYLIGRRTQLFCFTLAMERFKYPTVALS